MNRVIDLLEYWRRETRAQSAPAANWRDDLRQEVSQETFPDWEQPSEQRTQQAMSWMTSAMSGPGGLQPAGRIPDHLREMITWAEEKKALTRKN